MSFISVTILPSCLSVIINKISDCFSRLEKHFELYSLHSKYCDFILILFHLSSCLFNLQVLLFLMSTLVLKCLKYLYMFNEFPICVIIFCISIISYYFLYVFFSFFIEAYGNVLVRICPLIGSNKVFGLPLGLFVLNH